MEVRIKAPEAVKSYMDQFDADIESLILDLLVSELRPDPDTETKVRPELATMFLDEGLKTANQDPVQAS